MKVKLTGSKFNEHQGEIVEVVFVDEHGDAALGEEDREKYGYSWAFEGEFEVVYEGETDMKEEQQFTVTLKVKDLLELHDLLQTLPRFLVETATLTNN